KHEIDGKMISVSGSVMNRTQQMMSGVVAVVEMQETTGRFPQTQEIPLQPPDLPPQGVGTFMAMATLQENVGRHIGKVRLSEAGPNASTIVARDVNDLRSAVINNSAGAFPIQSLDHVPPGDYYVQALLASNRDLKSVSAPGNLYSDTQRVHLDPRAGGTVRLQLTKAIPPEELPPQDEFIRYVRIQSDLLTRFHGRPLYLRAGIILPKDYDRDTNRHFPLRISIGGYGARYTAVQ